MHSLGVQLHDESDRARIEAHAPNFVPKGLERAQKLSWEAVRRAATRIVPGTDDAAARRILTEELEALGSSRFWHKTLARVGSNTRYDFSENAAPNAVLEANDMFFLDIGPTWKFPEYPGVEWEGDVGETFVVGDDPRMHALANASRDLFEEGCAYWRENQCEGVVLYEMLEEKAARLGYRLLPDVDGHRISEFPHRPHFSGGLTQLRFVPSTHLWILEVHLVDETLGRGAFYEDVLR